MVPAQRARVDVDFAEVRADDRLLDVLGGAVLIRRLVVTDEELAALLVAWRLDVDDYVMPVPVRIGRWCA